MLLGQEGGDGMMSKHVLMMYLIAYWYFAND